MKKILFTVVVFSLVAFSAQAQLRYGLKGGLNISSLSGEYDDYLKSATGFYVGPTVELSIPVVGLGVEGSVLYSQKGIKSKGGTDIDEKISYIEVPVSLKYKLFDIPGLNKILTPFIDAGPYASLKISGDVPDIESAEEQVKAKSFGAGLNFGIGAELLGKIQIRAGYQLGLTDNFSEGDYGLKDRTWQVGASILF
ncbi:MAG: porin family protein [Prevotella sp.]|jgi:hypothetical protein|nr:porin family protein [Prevotella sp.]